MRTPFAAIPLFVLSIGCTALLSSCSESHADSAAPSAVATVPAATYKAGHGLRLTPAARAFIGLATIDFAGTRIPATAVLRTVKGDFVYVRNGDEFLRTPVTLGAADGDTTSFAITDGLYDGDTVVTQGVRALWLAELSATNGGVGCADGH